MIQKTCVVLVVLCSLAMLSGATQGQVFDFPIDGTQEVPLNASTGTGTGAVTLAGTNLSWNISWSGLGPLSGMHFHGNALPGSNAGVQVNIGSISGVTSPSIGNTTISASQAADIQAGLWYVNLHTSMFPGGEIRGQVVPEPLTLSLLGLGSAVLIRRRQRRNR